jgi:hypothetical protein
MIRINDSTGWSDEVPMGTSIQMDGDYVVQIDGDEGYHWLVIPPGGWVEIAAA